MNLLEECKKAGRIGISGHIRPDGDCIGSCMGLYLYLKKELPQAEIQVFLERPSDIYSCISRIEEVNSAYGEQKKFDVFFALDSTADRLGEAQPYFESAGKRINIDHHISNARGCGDVNFVDPQASSTSELVYRLIEETFFEKTYLQTQILGRALLESIRFMDGRCVVSALSRKTLDFYGAGPQDLEGIVSQLRSIKGVECAIFLYETGVQEYKVSLRSSEKVDVAAIASYFGGGGHVRAAGCTMMGTAHDVINNLSLHIERQLDGGEGNDEERRAECI